MNQFIRKRLDFNEISFKEQLLSLKIQTLFDLAVTKVAVKAADEKIFTFAGTETCLVISCCQLKCETKTSKKFYELPSVPISLAHSDFSLRKTSKSVLLSILEADEVVEPKLPKRPGVPVAHLIDSKLNRQNLPQQQDLVPLPLSILGN